MEMTVSEEEKADRKQEEAADAQAHKEGGTVFMVNASLEQYLPGVGGGFLSSAAEAHETEEQLFNPGW